MSATKRSVLSSRRIKKPSWSREDSNRQPRSSEHLHLLLLKTSKDGMSVVERKRDDLEATLYSAVQSSFSRHGPPSALSSPPRRTPFLEVFQPSCQERSRFAGHQVLTVLPADEAASMVDNSLPKSFSPSSRLIPDSFLTPCESVSSLLVSFTEEDEGFSSSR